MSKKIFTLVPEWVNFESFWIEIRKRNQWLIQLRYLAVLMLFAFIVGSNLLHTYFFEISLPFEKIIIFPPLILFYNILFHFLWKKYPEISKKTKLHSLHFSFLQITVDFIFLMLIIYFTGGVESPFNTFFVFHLIIGSLILPGVIVTTLITFVIIISICGSLLEFKGIIPHYQIYGIVKHSLYNDVEYLVVFFSTFAFVVYVSIYLANSISKVLYQREKALHIAFKQLKEAEKSKSRYVLTFVHDLKTPISAALTWVGVIKDKTLGEIPEYLTNPIERIENRLKGAISLIDDILKISQVKLITKIEKEQIDLHSLFEEIYVKHRILISSKNLDYKINIESSNPIIISDKNLLKLALSNLVSNAIKYTEPNGTIEISIKEKERNFEISVADNGIGIPTNEINKIFNEFYRSSISKERNIEGSGLGMALVKDIITKFGGDITVHSPSHLAEEGKPGTEFIITLPK